MLPSKETRKEIYVGLTVIVVWSIILALVYLAKNQENPIKHTLAKSDKIRLIDNNYLVDFAICDSCY
jgi:hypothetical protein